MDPRVISQFALAARGLPQQARARLARNAIIRVLAGQITPPGNEIPSDDELARLFAQTGMNGAMPPGLGAGPGGAANAMPGMAPGAFADAAGPGAFTPPAAPGSFAPPSFGPGDNFANAFSPGAPGGGQVFDVAAGDRKDDGETKDDFPIREPAIKGLTEEQRDELKKKVENLQDSQTSEPENLLKGGCRINELGEGEFKRVRDEMLSIVKEKGSTALRNTLEGLRKGQPPTEWGGFLVARLARLSRPDERGSPVRPLRAFPGTDCGEDGCSISLMDLKNNSPFDDRNGERIIGIWHTHPRCGTGWPRYHSDYNSDPLHGGDLGTMNTLRNVSKCFLGSFVVNIYGEISFLDMSSFKTGRHDQQYGDHRVHGWTSRDKEEFCKLHEEWERSKKWRR